MDQATLSYNIVCLALCAALMAVAAIVPILVWKKLQGRRASLWFLLWGALGFLVSARVLELGVHMVCIVLDNPVSRFINGHTWAYVLYGCAMAGIFEEVGRWVILGKIVKKDKTPENAVFYGLGHGAIEVLAVVLPSVLLYLVLALQIRDLGLAAALEAMNVPAGQEDTILGAIAAYDGSFALLSAFERMLAMIGHVGFTLVVFYGLQKRDSKYLLYAVLAHMLLDLAPALYQRWVLPLWSVEVWAALWDVALTVWAVKLYKRLKEDAA